MAARAEAYANLIADRMVSKLDTVSRASGGVDKWLTTPKIVRRGLLAGDLVGDKPALYVQVARWGEDQLQPGGHHDGVVTLHIHCVSEATVDGEDTKNAEQELNRLASDVIYAIANSENLAGSDGVALVDQIRALYYEPQTEAMERTGFGITTVVAEARFHWEHSAP